MNVEGLCFSLDLFKCLEYGPNKVKVESPVLL